MKQKCLTDTAIKGVFTRNQTKPDIYDLQTVSGTNFPFTYFRMTLPRSEYLKKNRAVCVAESHRNGIKVLFTGLRKTISGLVYSGNLYDTKTNKRSLLLFRYNPTDQTMVVYLFPNRNPRNINSYIKEVLK